MGISKRNHFHGSELYSDLIRRCLHEIRLVNEREEAIREMLKNQFFDMKRKEKGGEDPASEDSISSAFKGKVGFAGVAKEGGVKKEARKSKGGKGKKAGFAVMQVDEDSEKSHHNSDDEGT